MLDQKKRTLKRLGIAGVATAMTTMGIPGIAGAASLRVVPDATAATLTPPGAPSGLTATDVGANRIKLSWTAASGSVVGYNIYDSSTPNVIGSRYPTNGRVLVSGTSDTVTVSTTGTYYFDVVAVNAAGQGTPSGVANATAAPIAPSAPGGLTASPAVGGVTLAWTAPTTGDTPTSYTISYGTSATALGSSVTVSPTSESVPPTTHDITGLTDGTAYFFEVTATNAAGTSTPSSVISATPGTGHTPLAPSDVTAFASGGSVHLVWNEPSGSSNDVTGFNVYEGTAPGAESSTPVNGSVPISGTSGGSTTLTVPDGTVEYFTVKAVNSVGMSPVSEEASTQGGASAQPTPPQFVQVTPLDGAVKLTWVAPAQSGNSHVVDYRVSYTEDVSPFTNAVSSTGATSDLITGLNTSHSYTFTVEARNAAKEYSSPSNTVSTKPDVASAPSAPNGLTVTTQPSTASPANTLTWAAPTYTGGTGTTYDYRVLRNGTPIATVKSSKTSFVDTKSASGTSAGWTAPVKSDTYSYAVEAVDQAGSSTQDGPVSITTASATPGTPTGLGASVTASNTVKFSWGAPADQAIGGLQYQLLENGKPLGEPVSAVSESLSSLPTSAATYSVEAETTSTTGSKASAKTTIQGTSVGSAPITVWAVPTPNAPSITAAVSSPTSVKLSWTTPNGAAAPTNYVIERGLTASGTSASTTIDASTSFTSTGLTPGDQYYFRVVAQNSEADTSSVPSNTVSATPELKVTPPGAPSGLKAFVNGSFVHLSWTAASSSGSSPLAGYEVFESRTSLASTARNLNGQTLVPGTSAILDGLGRGTVELYVKSVNSSGSTSVLSAPVEVSLVADSTPSAPSAPQVSPGVGSATVVWGPPANDGNSAIVGYYVTAHLVGGKGKTIFTKGDVTKATIAGLMNGGSYYFTVVAVNSIGGGTPSAPSAIVKLTVSTTKVYVTPPAMLNAPGTAMIRVTVNMPTARVQLFDEANGKNFFFSKAIKETTPSNYGNGVAEFLVNIDATNHFYVMVNGVKSNVVTAMVK